jgi:putative hydrolase of the HAD superfamily
MIRTIIFDFGGVLAEEGFREGLMVIGKEKGLNPEDFYRIAVEMVYEVGYITGNSNEHTYWNAIRNKTGVKGRDKEFRDEILKRFKLRPEIIKVVEKLKSLGFTVAVLSDQTNWLDELNQRTPFYHHFDHIFNSFYLKKTKRDPSIFRDVCKCLGIQPEEVLFVDDNPENIERAARQGLRTTHFKSVGEFQKEFDKYLTIQEW